MITNFFAKQIHLTIIPRVRVGYEMVVGYNNLMSMQHAFFPTLFVKTTDFQLVFNFGQTRTVNIIGEHGIVHRFHLREKRAGLQRGGPALIILNSPQIFLIPFNKSV